MEIATQQSNLPLILIVEDGVRLAALVEEYLEDNGFQIRVEHSGERAAARILGEQPDLVILDLMLPVRDGFEICREVRGDFEGPILMHTARDEDVDQVVGLEIGADDYVTKPVQPRVLLARIRALLRRFEFTHSSEPPLANGEGLPLQIGALRIDPLARTVSLREPAVTLTTGEFDLLWFLARNVGEVQSRDTILNALRGIGYDGLDRSVDIGVSRLRRKLGDDADRPARIKTVRTRGYLLVPDA